MTFTPIFNNSLIPIIVLLTVLFASHTTHSHSLEKRGSEYGPSEDQHTTKSFEDSNLLSTTKSTESSEASTVPEPEPIPSLVNGTISSGNGTDGLFEVYKDAAREWMKKPLVHAVLVPGVIGVMAALITVCSVCCIHSCVKSAARKRRKRRIRNLSDELKTDRAMLLAEDSDEEF